MVLESLRVRKEHVDSHLASLDYHVRLSHYGGLPATAGGNADEATYAVAHKQGRSQELSTGGHVQELINHTKF